MKNKVFGKLYDAYSSSDSEKESENDHLSHLLFE